MNSAKLTRLLRGAAPWLLAFLLLAWLFGQYPLQDVLAAARHVSLPALTTFLLAYFAWFSVFDIWSLHRALAANGINGRLMVVMKLRFASNFAMILNYGLGQGVLAYLIKRSFGDSFLRVSGVLALIILTDLLLALTISLAGTFFTDAVVRGHDLAPWIRVAWGGAVFGVLALIALWRAPLGGARWLRVKSNRLFHALNNLDLAGFLAIALRRLPLVAVACIYLWFLAHCFDVRVPLDKVVVLLPLTIVIGAIPITPSGLGTVQVTSIYLFSEFVSGPAIAAGQVSAPEVLLAMSLLFTLGIYALKLASGAVFFRAALARGSVG